MPMTENNTTLGKKNATQELLGHLTCGFLQGIYEEAEYALFIRALGLGWRGDTRFKDVAIHCMQGGIQQKKIGRAV